jgi:hypothetical protein
MPRDPNRCPNCGERVSPFAAGCALCGAELDPHRHRRRMPRLDLGRLPSPGVDAFAVALLVLLTLFAPLIGLVVCGLRAWNEERSGRVLQRNIALVLGGVCLVFLFGGSLQFDVLRQIGLP